MRQSFSVRRVRLSGARQIPSPNVAEGHQLKNASLLADLAGSKVITEDELDSTTLGTAIEKILGMSNQLKDLEVDEINIGVSEDGIILLAMLDASLVFMRATGWMLVTSDCPRRACAIDSDEAAEMEERNSDFERSKLRWSFDYTSDFELYSPFAEGAQRTLSSSFASGRDLSYILYCIYTYYLQIPSGFQYAQ
ncbi:hypothetical protein RHSIM_Rhsim08G0129900 [Rhododendron simsii]|uniref:Glycosyl transferase family 28 C-terminal domain-containing protein n=1 Tax=Rhododendron simsii TaxID=118357 RepID=A0A834GIM7_RHOSS|nr:hypothetical protein RHSIM_Rhsim08G0129900 [Rhododendron simsii]